MRTPWGILILLGLVACHSGIVGLSHPRSLFHGFNNGPQIKMTKAEIQINPSAQLFISEANHFMTQVQRTCQASGLHNLWPTQLSPDNGFIQEHYIAMSCATVSITGIVPGEEPCRSFWIFNHENKTPPVSEHWTEDRALEIGKSFLALVAVGEDVKLGKPQATRRSSADGNVWVVTWKRIDDEGHPFHSDQVEFSLPEGCGPSSASVFLSQGYKQQVGKLLNESTAKSCAQELLGSKTLHFSPGSLEIVYTETGPRMAWIFSYIDDPTAGYRWPTIFIDAYTGDEIGGEMWASSNLNLSLKRGVVFNRKLR